MHYQNKTYCRKQWAHPSVPGQTIGGELTKAKLMDRHEAYSIARREIEQLSKAPPSVLRGMVERTDTREITGDSGIVYSVDTRPRWQDKDQTVIEICVTVNSPSIWKLGRLEESTTVRLPGGS